MTFPMLEFVKNYGAKGEDVLMAGGQNLKPALRRWFSTLESEPNVASIVQELESKADFDAWYKAIPGDGETDLNWPEEDEPLIGMRLAFFKRISTGEIDAAEFALINLPTGATNIDQLTRLITSEFFRSLQRDLLTIIQRRLDDQLQPVGTTDRRLDHSVAPSRPKTPDETPFDAFQARQARRLNDMRHDLRVELNRPGMAITPNSRSIFPRITAAEASIDAAIEAVLGEAVRLTSGRGSTTSLWTEETAARARTVLLDHLETVFGDSLDNRVPGVRASVDQARERMLARVEGEVDDFAAGVWQPRQLPGRAYPPPPLRQGETPAPSILSGDPDDEPMEVDEIEAEEEPDPYAEDHDDGVEPADSVAPLRRSSAAFNTSQFNTFAFNAAGPPSAGAAPVSLNASGRAASAARATLTLSGPAPEVPEPGPALVELQWANDRLELVNGVPANDLWDDAILNLLSAVRQDFVAFVDALHAMNTNFHPTARDFIESIPDLLAAHPDQLRVFRIGHAVEHLESLQQVADEELPDALRVRYGTIVAQLRRCVERFPAWRGLIAQSQAEPLTADQADQAIPVARELATALSSQEASEVVDSAVPAALIALADMTEGAPPAERRLLNFDLVASVRAVTTMLFKPVLHCWREFGDGAWAEMQTLPRKFGTGTVTWTSRAVLALGSLYIGAAPLSLALAHAATVYPSLAWLGVAAEFLKFLAALKV